MHRPSRFLIKFCVTAFLFWLVVQKVDVSHIADLLTRARPAWLFASFVLVVAMTVMDGLSFSVLMRILGHRVGLQASFLYSLVSWFFSNLAPATFGGDAFRTIQMRRLGAPLGTAVRAVLTARLMSFATLVPVILAGLPIALDIVANPIQRATLIIIAALCAGALLTAGASIALAPHIGRFAPERVADKITAFAADFRKVNRAGWQSVSYWLLSAGQHVVRVGVLSVLAASLHIEIPFATLFALAPAALLVAMIPVSLGSWGLREASFVVFLGGAGIAPDAALLLSVAFGLLRLLIGGVGGLVWLATDRKHYGFELDAGRGAGAKA